MKNRAAAQDSRDRKRKYVSDLEATNALLLQQNAALQSRLKLLEDANAALTSRLSTISNLLSIPDFSLGSPEPEQQQPIASPISASTPQTTGQPLPYDAQSLLQSLLNSIQPQPATQLESGTREPAALSEITSPQRIQIPLLLLAERISILAALSHFSRLMRSKAGNGRGILTARLRLMKGLLDCEDGVVRKVRSGNGVDGKVKKEVSVLMRRKDVVGLCGRETWGGGRVGC